MKLLKKIGNAIAAVLSEFNGIMENSVINRGPHNYYRQGQGFPF